MSEKDAADEAMRQLQEMVEAAESLASQAKDCLKQVKNMIAADNLVAAEEGIAGIVAISNDLTSRRSGIPGLPDLPEVDLLKARIYKAGEKVYRYHHLAQDTYSKAGLKLVVSYREAQQVEAFAPVRWCITNGAKAVLGRLINSAVTTYWLLISVVHETVGEVDRRVVPLEAMMEYLRFNRVGHHTIYASVVKSVGNKEQATRRRSALLERDTPSNFANKLFHQREGGLDYHPEWVEGHPLGLNFFYQTSIEVVVPAEFFGKPLSPRMKWWLSWMMRGPNWDDCTIRKKKLIAFTIQLPLFALVMLAKYLIFLPSKIVVKIFWAAIGTLLGVRLGKGERKVDWSRVFNLAAALDDIWDGKLRASYCLHLYKCKHGYGFHGGSYILYDRRGRERNNVFLWPLTPAIWVGGMALGFVLGARFYGDLLKTAVLGVGTMIGIVIFLYLCTGFVALRKALAWFWDKKHKDSREEKRRAMAELDRLLRRQQERALQSRLDRLTCDVVPIEVAVEALPPERQTFYLRFMRLKAKICKPQAIGG